MEIGLWFIILALVVMVIVLGIKIHLMQKSVEEIACAFENRLNTDTNTLIDISSGDRKLCYLAASINTQLRQLRKERQEYQQGHTELRDAITNIAHDLRTPLTTICGYLDLMEQEEKSPTMNRYISLIANRTETLRNLTEEFFQYSVMVSTKEASTEYVVLNHALEETLISFFDTMEKHGIAPKINIPKTKVERFLNPSALSRVFENIISNALKYSDGDFEVWMDENGSISFANTSSTLTGIEVGKLFNRFFTVETGRESTGLGLSIAKLLTERMGGEITAVYQEKRVIITVLFPADVCYDKN